MPGSASVSFRDQTTGRINDLLLDEGLTCAHSQTLLSFLAGALLNYKEEGIEFTPSVILCVSLNNFLKSFPGAVAHEIGKVPLDPSSAPRILKDCAPLTNKNWYVFIERVDQNNARYGVFTYFRLPTAIPLHEGIAIDSSEFCVLIRKISTNTIEIRGAKGSILTLIFSTVRDPSAVDTTIQEFSEACCVDVDDPKIKNEFKNYFRRLLQDALTSSHGTMLVCGRDLKLSDIPELQDAVPVSPVLDFQTAFTEYHISNSAGSILNLQRCEELLHGLLRCDGIIAFDTYGRIVAYRAIFRPQAGAPPIPPVVGGTRRRAYEGLKGLVGPRLISVLFRSQDGLTLHHGAPK
jgi:hypothetical protein